MCPFSFVSFSKVKGSDRVNGEYTSFSACFTFLLYDDNFRRADGPEPVQAHYGMSNVVYLIQRN